MRLLDRQPPERLYHYTTTAGLLGIIQHREIWATHTQYLNDLLEFRHAVDIVREELDHMRESGADGARTHIIERLQENTRDIERANVCVTSFSEGRDSLSQWRAYSGGGAGFSIGFSSEFLRSVLNEEFFLRPCLYEEDEQREFVRDVIQDVMGEDEGRSGHPDDGLNASTASAQLNAHLLAYAALLKHQSFEAEREWRISGLVSCERFNYRPGASMLIPYYRIPLGSDDVPFRIEEIVVGPAPYPRQSCRSVDSLLTTCCLQDVKVVESRVPYRSW